MLNFDSTLGSLVIVLVMLGLITAFAVWVNVLLTRMWREEPQVAEARVLSETPLRKAA